MESTERLPDERERERGHPEEAQPRKATFAVVAMSEKRKCLDIS